MEDVDREISEMKLSLNARARIVAESYLGQVSFVLINPFFFAVQISFCLERSNSLMSRFPDPLFGFSYFRQFV